MNVRRPRGPGWLWLLLTLGLLAMAPALIGRVVIEQTNATYELSMPDADLVAMLHAGIDPDELYGELGGAGLGSVAVEMRTTGDLEAAGEILILSRPEMLEMLLVAGEPVSDLPRGTAMFVSLIRGHEGLLEAISAADPSSRIEPIEIAGREFHMVSGIPRFEDLPIGYDDARVRELTDRGFEVIARIPERLNAPAFVIDELAGLEQEFGVQRVLFTGDRVPSAGSADAKEEFAGWLRDNGFVLLLIEFEEQEGIDAYVRRIDRGIRLHSIDLGRDAEADLGVDRAVRAVKERSVRIVFVRPNETIGARGRLDEFVSALSGMRAAMPGWLHPGVAEPFRPLVSTPLLAAGALASSIAIAALAGAMLGPLLSMVLGVGTALVGVAASVTGEPSIGDPFRLGVAILSAVLALYVAGPARGRRAAAIEYGKAALVIFAGGLTLTGLAYDNDFLLNADDFWGVKALLLAPLMIAGVVALYHSLGRPGWSDARNVIRMPVEAWHVVALAAAGFVVWYFLLRSGNTGTASDLELTLRQELENLVYVRPRTKEFLIGFPALLVGIVLAARTRHGWWLYAVAAIGTASAIDTFTHFHTPLLVSVLRTGLSLAIGFGLGMVVLAALGPVERWVRRTDGFRSP
ncbi:MAG TPA: DUF5693 family protein [Candidatus Limnocylindrales bacterium]|nr:DUF5693 family protein [Candidatus Limnocylindrales bacterium]